MVIIKAKLSFFFLSNTPECWLKPLQFGAHYTFRKKKLLLSVFFLLLGFGQSNKPNTFEAHIDDTTSLNSTNLNDPSQADFRVSQLISQPESQDELYKSRLSMVSSTLSLDDQQKAKNLNENLSTYRLHPGNYSTIFYYLDFQAIRGLLIAPYFTLNKLTQTTLIDRLLFETIQQTCVYIKQKHFSKRMPISSKNLFSTKSRPKYHEIGCQFSIRTDSDKKKKDTNSFNFWIVAKKCLQPMEHEFFVCYHDSIAQNITELAFTIGMSSI